MYDTRTTERRRTRRVRMKQGLRVRPSDPKDGAFQEITSTKNVSQDGLYFVTDRTAYHEGMRLFVTAPYHSPFSEQNYEYLAQIARIDNLENGQKGVAVRFLSAAKRGT
ncbi:MAG: PilZ domain-containing protein [Candidatus Acidiferrum sp.]